jgi:hypothetical protein
MAIHEATYIPMFGNLSGSPGDQSVPGIQLGLLS